MTILFSFAVIGAIVYIDEKVVEAQRLFAPCTSGNSFTLTDITGTCNTILLVTVLDRVYKTRRFDIGIPALEPTVPPHVWKTRRGHLIMSNALYF